MFSSPIRAANSSSLRLCSAFRRVGTSTRTRTSRSPRDAGAEAWHAFAAELEERAALGAGGNLERTLAFEGRDPDLAADGGGDEFDRDLAEKVIFLALEDFVLLDVDDDVEVAGRTAADAGLAIAGGAEAGAILDAGRES